MFNIIDENGGAAAFKITERGITYYNEKVWIGSYFYFSIIATDSACVQICFKNIPTLYALLFFHTLRQTCSAFI